jgi:hypothetical protein
MTEKAQGEKTNAQQLLHEKRFHGAAGYVSVLSEVMEGKGEAGAAMFDRIPIENNREGNDKRTASHMLRLLDIFSCDQGE